MVHALRCTEHGNSVCLKVGKDGILQHHQQLFPNKIGHPPPVRLGFLLDTDRKKWSVYNVKEEKLITTVHDIDISGGEFTLMFGVYGHTVSKIKLSVITGRDLDVSDTMYNLIEAALLE